MLIRSEVHVNFSDSVGSVCLVGETLSNVGEILLNPSSLIATSLSQHFRKLKKKSFLMPCMENIGEILLNCWRFLVPAFSIVVGKCFASVVYSCWTRTRSKNNSHARPKWYPRWSLCTKKQERKRELVVVWRLTTASSSSSARKEVL